MRQRSRRQALFQKVAFTSDSKNGLISQCASKNGLISQCAGEAAGRPFQKIAFTSASKNGLISQCASEAAGRPPLSLKKKSILPKVKSIFFCHLLKFILLMPNGQKNC
ncbi:hypothetical protein [Chitinophaga sp.]|uniref:hypothetical protein n=1 Tax=Chitinophaga sp. TaxID=1869181 RepID=UPI0031E1FB8E